MTTCSSPPLTRSPNPNNPMEYCSTIPPHKQVSGEHKDPARAFRDGIAPGSDLAIIDQWNEPKQPRRQSERTHQRQSNSNNIKPPSPGGLIAANTVNTVQQATGTKGKKATDVKNNKRKESQLVLNIIFVALLNKVVAEATPILVNTSSGKSNNANRSKPRLPPSGCDEDESGFDFDYKCVVNNYELLLRLQKGTLKFAEQTIFLAYVKIVNCNYNNAQKNCCFLEYFIGLVFSVKRCLNRTVINFTTEGMHHVGNDEIIILLECNIPASKEELHNPLIPKYVFVHLNEIYNNANKGNRIAELSHTSPAGNTFLGSRNYGGFIYIRRPLSNVCKIVPENPYLIGILIHRHEVPWAKDFRNYSYTLPFIHGMYIHMEDRQTTAVVPRNRLEDVVKAINNSTDHIPVFGGNFSKTADGHLDNLEKVEKSRFRIFIVNGISFKCISVTGASFLVLNESLKASSGFSGKCSIVEDGLMFHILPGKIEEIRNALKNQNDVTIVCGPVNADEQQTEIVSLKWVDNDKEIIIGVKSPIDERLMDGISSMRVHASFNYSNTNYAIRLTDIYVFKYAEWYANASTLTPIEITLLTEQIARSISIALVPCLDLLTASKHTKIGLRFTLHQDSVKAGAGGSKLPPLYMNALDNHLIPTLHRISANIEDAIIIIRSAGKLIRCSRALHVFLGVDK
uniref:Uncharacterized protein n=1 Tax=Glossina pallidipes TaxID=7398 RepID=A0A1B0AC63_GLOPL